MPTIEIIVDPQGKTKVEGQGFTGKSCQDATRAIREALGQQVDERRKAEYYQTARQATRQQTGG